MTFLEVEIEALVEAELFANSTMYLYNATIGITLVIILRTLCPNFILDQ